MATYTKNYNLIKPAPEDFGDVADLNANADKVDEVLKKKADLDANQRGGTSVNGYVHEKLQPDKAGT